jgi:hypothetical protein
MTAAFTGADQKVIVGKLLTQPLDLAGGVMSAYLRIDQDPATGPGPYTATQGTPDPTSSASLYAKGGSNYRWINGPWVNQVPGGWIALELDFNNPSYVDPNDASTFDSAEIRELGIQINAPGPGTYTTGKVHLDSITTRMGVVRPEPPWTFDCDTESFAVTYVSHKSLVPVLSWSDSVGSSQPGSLKLTAEFRSALQEIGVGRILGGRAIDLR